MNDAINVTSDLRQYAEVKEICRNIVVKQCGDQHCFTNAICAAMESYEAGRLQGLREAKELAKKYCPGCMIGSPVIGGGNAGNLCLAGTIEAKIAEGGR